MPMRVRISHGSIVRVSVMLVVHMAVLMLDRIVGMFMLMPLCEMEPEAKSHEQASDDELRGDRLAQQDNGNHRADKRSRKRDLMDRMICIATFVHHADSGSLRAPA
jgi:hypothetical protein